MTPSAFRHENPRDRAATCELLEKRDRDAAAIDDRALVLYLAKWQRKLRRLQRAYPQRWHVPGLSDEEVRDALTLRLIEVVKGRAFDDPRLQRAGKEWGLLLLQRELRSLRRSFRIHTLPADLSEAPLEARAPTLEERWLEGEAELGRRVAQVRAEQGLTLPQRKWLAALKSSARAGGFFDSSAAPNLSAASRALGKNRSSAQRAFRELRTRFVKELKRLG